MAQFRRSSIALSIALFLLIIAPIFAQPQVAWVKDFNAALKQAARDKKFIVLDVSASW